MKAYIVFSSTEPRIVLTRTTIRDDRSLCRLREMGCTKFIAREVPIGRVRQRYGVPFEVIAGDLESGPALRVMDFKGERVLDAVSLGELGSAFRYESPALAD